MKNTYRLIIGLLLATTLFSCQKDLEDQYIGEWALIDVTLNGETTNNATNTTILSEGKNISSDIILTINEDGTTTSQGILIVETNYFSNNEKILTDTLELAAEDMGTWSIDDNTGEFMMDDLLPEDVILADQMMTVSINMEPSSLGSKPLGFSLDFEMEMKMVYEKR